MSTPTPPTQSWEFVMDFEMPADYLHEHKIEFDEGRHCVILQTKPPSTIVGMAIGLPSEKNRWIALDWVNKTIDKIRQEVKL